MRKIAILGSTGSIGTQALEVIRRQGGREVAALAAMKNIDRLEEQLREFSPRLVCVYDEAAAKELAARAADTGVKVVSGMDGLIEAATMADVDLGTLTWTKSRKRKASPAMAAPRKYPPKR